MTHVFVSFVEENLRLASWIVGQLRENSLEPWFSKDEGRITPGDEWERVLRSSIQNGGYYLPIFTREWAERNRSVANQELMVAAEEARLRPPGRRWIIPLKADDAPLPPVDLGGGRQLSDLHYVDVPQLGWERGLNSLMQALGVERPVIGRGEPIAPGFGANARIVGGFVTYRNFSVPLPEMDGTTFTVTGGYIARTQSGALLGNFTLRAPFEGLQNINSELGLDSIDVVTGDRAISTDPARPSHFSYLDAKDPRGPGMPLWMLGVSDRIETAISIEQQTGYEADGYLTIDDQVVGSFTGFIETASEIGKIRVTFEGDFNLQLKDTVAPPRL